MQLNICSVMRVVRVHREGIAATPGSSKSGYWVLGKMRNHRLRQRRGPLVVCNEDNGIVKAF
jgi:hypothetical protein